LKFFFILFFFTSFAVSAHQPKLINYSPSIDNPHNIADPEISKAYYSKLTGEPHYYQIKSNEQFLFYTGILSPKVSSAYEWFSLDVIDKDNNIIYQADGSSFDWKAWYEPYARDDYWKGPEIGLETNKEFKTSFPLEAGTYFIKVYNENNIGHYSLAVGEAEFFGANFWEQILTWTPILLYISPFMDIVHWKKFDIRAYIPHIMLLVIFFILYFSFRKIFYRSR